ncbi:MAG TPA: hypothetical protein VE779_08105 [Candidatus Angelobacter sp.]|jgi:hypothetical protein|nr:hypothetical protein [Candidatus Angelobacter sp.]
MGVRVASVWSNVQANAMPAGAASVALLVTPPLVLATDGAQVRYDFMLNVTPGTGSTLCLLQAWRGIGTSAVLFLGVTWQHTTVANKAIIFAGSAVDQPGAGVWQYQLIFSQSAGSAGSYADGCLLAFVL